MSRNSISKQDDSPDSRLNMRKPLPTVAHLHAQGKTMRESVPRELHGQWKPDANREDVLSIIRRSNAGRQKRLIPLRMERMTASPFAFLRGAAAVMAYDLSPTPTIGYNVVLAGDAHLGNFGLYGTPQREVVFDLNDFDETVVGPWEWDLKRLDRQRECRRTREWSLSARAACGRHRSRPRLPEQYGKTGNLGHLRYLAPPRLSRPHQRAQKSACQSSSSD
jgi:hypothetical protein